MDRDRGEKVETSPTLLVPVLSVIIPVHNADGHGAELHENLSSWFACSSLDVEVIVCDDGSSPAAISSCIALSKEHSFASLKVVSLSEQSGPGASRNAGLQVARGSAIYFADSDDLPHPPTVLRAATLVTKDAYDVAQFAYVERSWGDESPEGANVVTPAPSGDLANCLVRRAAVWRFVFRHSFLEEAAAAFRSLHYAEDLLFLLELNERAPNLATIEDVGYTHRVGRAGSASTGVAVSDHREAVRQLLEVRRRARLPSTRRLADLWIGRIIMVTARLDAPTTDKATTFFQDLREVGWRTAPCIVKATTAGMRDWYGRHAGPRHLVGRRKGPS